MRQRKTVWEWEVGSHLPKPGAHYSTDVSSCADGWPTALTLLLMRNSCSMGRRHLHVMLRNAGACPPAGPVVHYQPIMGEPSLVSQPPRAQHQNELLHAGAEVTGHLGAESASDGFQLCVSWPLQGRREARREKGSRLQLLWVMTVESVSQGRPFPSRPLHLLGGYRL